MIRYSGQIKKRQPERAMFLTHTFGKARVMIVEQT